MDHEMNDIWSNLPQLDSDARRELYLSIYEGRICMLSDIAVPAACKTFPDLADEIFEAYTMYTTFHVKVWVNYDCVKDAFYNDRRAQHCGKLRLKCSKQIMRLVKIARFNRVRFEICTLLNSHATMKLDLFAEDPEERLVWGPTRLSRRMTNFLALQTQILYTQLKITGYGELELNELKEVAKLFRAVLKPDQESVYETQNGWIKPKTRFREWTEADGEAEQVAERKHWASHRSPYFHGGGWPAYPS